MKKTFILLTLATSLLLASTSMAQTQNSKVLRHVVLFKFKDSSSEADVKKVEDAFKALKGKISLIKDFEWGKNTSPENLNQGLTHCFLATFTSDKDRDDYLVHPDHKAFVEVLKPHLDKVTVIDYWAGR
jgi:hypothetical protein